MASKIGWFLTIAAVAGSVVIWAAVALTLWPSKPTDFALTRGRQPSDGETVGWVSKVEPDTIHVNAGPFGGGVVALEVTKDTKITVGTKDGWFEDIRPGGQVKVAYEVYNGRRRARTVELLVDEGPRRPIHTEPRVKSTGGGAATERVPAKPSVATTSTPDARPAPTSKATEPPPATPPVVKAKVPEPVPATPPVVTPPAPTPAPKRAGSAKPAPLSQPEARPAPKPEPTRVQAAEVPPPQRASPTPARSAAAPEEPALPPSPPPAAPASAGRIAESVRPQEGGDSTDGSDAVDWFLKGRR